MPRRARRFWKDPSPLWLFGLLFLVAFYKVILALLGIAALLISLYYGYRWHRRRQWREKLLQSDIAEIDRMDGAAFEVYLQELFTRLGYRAERTPTSGDYGADLILSRHGETIAVQAKRYGGPVGVKAIQEVTGSLPFYHAQQGWVITNSHFTDQARQLAKANSVTLIDRQELVNLICDVQRQPEKFPTIPG